MINGDGANAIVPSLPGVDDIVQAYDQTVWTPIIDRHYAFVAQAQGLRNLIPVLVQAYGRIRSFKGRKVILHFLLPHVRCVDEVFALGLVALGDRSRDVREDALALIAYALDERALPALAAHARHRDPRDRESAEAAMAAIRAKNHHLFLDRDHSGNANWVVQDACGDTRNPARSDLPGAVQ